MAQKPLCKLHLLAALLLGTLLPLPNIAIASAKRPPAAAVKSTLVLGLDGIGYSLFLKMREGGHFRNFKNPAPMVASFPSVSDPNWAMITGSKPSESYTKEFFNFDIKTEAGQGQIVGSLMDHLAKPPDFEKIFNFRPEGVVEHLISLTWRETSALFWLDSLEEELVKAKYPKVYSALNINTDLMSHTKGEATVIPYLVEVDRRVQKIMASYRKKFGTDMEVIIISDHGNIFTSPRSAMVDDHLQGKGWRVVSSLKEKKDVAYANPECISFASFYCLPGSEEALAADLSGAEAVHLTMIKSGSNQVDFFGEGGKNRARALIDPLKETVQYTVLAGKDPLDHAHLFNKGPIKWSHYLLETLKSEYPYAAVRVWAGFFTSVQKPGMVLVSPKNDYVFASKPMKLLTSITGLVGTHGSLQREESLGVFVSTAREFPPISPEHFTKFVQWH